MKGGREIYTYVVMVSYCQKFCENCRKKKEKKEWLQCPMEALKAIFSSGRKYPRNCQRCKCGSLTDSIQRADQNALLMYVIAKIDS
jgi:hypothetical protein